MTKRVGVPLFFCALAALAASCGGSADKPEPSGGGGDEIRIGVVHPLSGPVAAYGKGSLSGVKMRVDELNAAGGVGGRKIRLCVEDDKGDSTAAVNSFTKLVGSDKVVAVIAPVTSTCTLALRAKAKEFGIPTISPTATNDTVTLNHNFMFRACFNDSFQGRIVANYAANDLGVRKAAVLKDINSDYSKGLCANFARAFKAAGGEVAAEEGYQQGDTSFGAQLKKVKDSGAELLFVPGYPPEVPLIIKQAKALGLSARLCGADGWDNDAVLGGSGDHIAGSFLVGAFAREDARPVVQKFVAAYTEREKAPPDTFAALGYDTMSLLAEAMNKGATSAAIREGLSGIKGFEAVTGKIDIVGGDAVKPAVILEVAKAGDRMTAKYKATVNP